MQRYENLSQELNDRIIQEKANKTQIDFSFDENKALRRNLSTNDGATVWRTAFIRDIDKILYCPFYNRYADKTQVLSLYKNDDITHRSLHVQLVSRIARTIGKTLNLNLDLIEAISLGHDIGHTPFGHTGEKILSSIYHEKTGRFFNHNIHSVRVLDQIFPLNLTLQTLNGIASHNGELELSEYRPIELNDFDEFDNQLESCYLDEKNVLKLTPCTLEGCVVRISDIIAYLGKDRHDAENSDIAKQTNFEDYGLGKLNAEIINNLIVNLLENSYGKPYIKMDDKHFIALKQSKNDNYEFIYKNQSVKKIDDVIEIIMRALYEQLFDDLVSKKKTSPVFTHHIDYLNKPYYVKRRKFNYENSEPNQIIVDYLASMTDDYMVELYHYLFPNSAIKTPYKGYFDK